MMLLIILDGYHANVVIIEKEPYRDFSKPISATNFNGKKVITIL
jgi:hypothetical protein